MPSLKRSYQGGWKSQHIWCYLGPGRIGGRKGNVIPRGGYLLPAHLDSITSLKSFLGFLKSASFVSCSSQEE